MLLHLLRYKARLIEYRLLQILIDRFLHAAILYNTFEVLIAHGNGTLHKISEDIGKLRIVTLYHELPGNHTVIFKGHLMENKETNRIHAEETDEIIRINHIPSGFRHLRAFLRLPRCRKKPGMTEYLLGKGNIETHKENRPIYRMETHNILSNQV